MATADLIRRLYLELLRLIPTEAQHAAQISVRREARWAAPYYRVRFMLKGECQQTFVCGGTLTPVAVCNLR
jgi:hypothetical protein